MTPSDAATATAPSLGRVGSAWYFDPATVAAGKAIGLDGFRFYFLGRGGVLGPVDWQVVSSAFGYFAPALLERMWTTANGRCPVEKGVAAHLAACAEWGRAHLGGLAGLEAFVEAAATVVAASGADVGGLPLFAGYARQPVPADTPARAVHLASVLRELRGSVHLAAIAAVGLPTGAAHAIRRPGDVELFGWAAGELPEPTDADRAALAEADRLTAAAMTRRLAVLDEAGLEALAAGASALLGRVPA